MNNVIIKELAKVVDDLGVVRAGEGEEFTLASGAKSNYYIDCRRVSLHPHGLKIIVSAMLEELRMHDDVVAVGGPVIGADPIVGGIVATCDNYRGFLVRKETKEHGMQNLIEGNLQVGDRVAIIEDVVTSGGSVMTAVKNVEAFGAHVMVVIPVLDRLAGAADIFENAGYVFSPLLTIKDLTI